jgi:hypothetical protein
MEPSLQTLLAKQEIVDTINHLFVGTDRRDWPRVSACFAPSVLFDMTSLAGGAPQTLTPQQIVDGWEAGLKPLQAIHHQSGNFLVNVAGDSADAFCYGIALHYLPNKTGRDTRSFVGSYDFHLTHHAGRWRIDRFKFNLKYIDGNKNLESS